MLNKLTGNEYKDATGNYVCATNQIDNIWFEFQGQDNVIEIKDKVSIGGQLRFSIRGSNHRLKIEENVSFIGVCMINFVSDNMNFYIDENCSFNNISINAWGNSTISVGKGCTFGPNNNLYCSAFSKMLVGDDCMTSSDVMLQTGDGHTIFDLEKGLNINTDLNNAINGYLDELVLGNHIWVGRRCFVLGGVTRIGEGTVIGAQSFVKGNVPNNVIIAGDPAKIIKRNIAWSRKSRTLDLNDCNGYINKTEW